MNNATAITLAVIGIAVVAGAGYYFVSQAKQSSTADALAAYERGRKSVKLSRAQKITGAAETLGTEIWDILD